MMTFLRPLVPDSFVNVAVRINVNVSRISMVTMLMVSMILLV